MRSSSTSSRCKHFLARNESLNNFFQDDETEDSSRGIDDFHSGLSLELAGQKNLKGYELLALRRHHNLEVRNLANMIGNDLEKVEYIELDDFLGIDETKALKLSILRIKNMQLGDNLPDNEAKAN